MELSQALDMSTLAWISRVLWDLSFGISAFVS